VKIPAYGRFRHEAVGIDPQTFDAYLTEDRPDGCLYRFVARSKETPFEGQLQAMALDVPDVSQLAPGEQATVRWVDVDGADARADDLRSRARRSGAARVARGEGLLAELRDGRTRVLFVATIGGRQGKGQVLELTPTREGGVLTCLLEATEPDQLEMPDNVCVSPSGHVLLAEDGPSPNGVMVACPSGTLVPLLVNTGEGEIAGVTFFDDKLFLNLQQRGLTLVVSGPFSSIA
jgi:secreted PhoX family phosphatase